MYYISDVLIKCLKWVVCGFKELFGKLDLKFLEDLVYQGI